MTLRFNAPGLVGAPSRMSVEDFRRRLSGQAPVTQPATPAVSAPRPMRRQPEHEEQVRLFALIELLAHRHPEHAGELEDVWSTSSGGKRHRGAAGRLRDAGQRRGVPDIECWVPRGAYHGLVIELKAEKGRATREQADRLARLSARGYVAIVCHGWVAAGQALCDYLGLAMPADAETAVEMLLVARRAQRRAARRAAGVAERRAAGGHETVRRFKDCSA